MTSRPLLILDSSPLITLSLFPIHRPAIETVLSIADVMIVQTVAEEVTSFPTHRDAKVVQQLLDKQRITSKPVPVTPVDGLIDSYNKVDDGERDTLRLALTTPHSYLILDDVAAFITAAHFGLTPVMLLDLLALWAKTGLLDKMSTLKILAAIGSRYSEAFVKHTKHKLNEV